MGLFDFLKGKPRQDPSGGESPRILELVQQLDDPDAKVRLRACRELGGFGHGARAASEKLQQLLDDVDGDVCNAAAAALSEIER